VFKLRENESTYIPKGETHRIENHEKAPLEIIEIQTGNMIGKKVYPILSHMLQLKHELYIAPTVPIKIEGKKKPKGVKRLNDLISFNINIPDLIKHLE